MGREQRQLALGDDMALVDAHEEAGLGLRRRHEDQPFPAHAQTKGEISLSGSREARVSDRLWRRRRGAEGAYLTWRSEPAATEAKP